MKGEKFYTMPAYTLVVHMYAKPDCVDKLKEKLQEANQVYPKDKECLSWYFSYTVYDCAS